MLPVLILSGGLATRLRPLTERIPKALVPVAGKPFVVHQLEFLRAQKIRRVILLPVIGPTRSRPWSATEPHMDLR